MRLNKYIAYATGLSRRAADQAINEGRVSVNDAPPQLGTQVTSSDQVTLDGQPLAAELPERTIMLHKPVGYIVSRNGQGSKTIYDLLASELHVLKPIGRLDKDSSGLLLLTSDGQLANELTHPSHHKVKVYEVSLNKALTAVHHQMIHDIGITLVDGVSRLQLARMHEGNDKDWLITMHEGRNRQIRRTFEALNYRVNRLHRTQFAHYRLDELAEGQHFELSNESLITK